MPEAIGGIVGGIFGGNDGGGGSQTASKEPWAEAAPWIKDNIKTGQDLQRYYQQNPFNSLQQTGYQNQFADLDQFRNQMAPGLIDFANKLMGSNYQRAAAGTEIGATNPYAAQAMMPAMLQKQAYQASQGGGQTGAQGLMGQGGPSMQSTGLGLIQGRLGNFLAARRGVASSQAEPSGSPVRWNGTGAVPLDGPVTQQSLLADPMYGRPTGQSTPSGGLFSAPQGQSYGLLDFQQLNPFTSPNGIQAMPKPMADDKTIQQLVQEELDRQRYGQVDGYLAANGSA